MGRSHQARCAVIEQITAWLTQHTYLRGTGDAQEATRRTSGEKQRVRGASISLIMTGAV